MAKAAIRSGFSSHTGLMARVLDPAKPGCHGGVWLLIRLENRRIRTGVRVERRRQPCPAILLLWIGQALHLHYEAIARLQRGWLRLRWASPPRTARAAGLCHHAIAYHMIPPGMWATTAPSRPLPLIGSHSGFRVRQARTPLGLHTVDVVGHSLGFFALSAGIGLGLLVR
jgi:hypothetical protein